MSLEALVLQFLLSHSDGVAKATPSKPTPSSQVDMQILNKSFADLSEGILKCYHRTGRFHHADIVQLPWPRQQQYAADKSALVKITYLGGVTGNSYEMVVGILGKDQSIRTVVWSDSSPIKPNKKCALEKWTSATPNETVLRKSSPEMPKPK